MIIPTYEPLIAGGLSLNALVIDSPEIEDGFGP
jgi:hypothetical protein